MIIFICWVLILFQHLSGGIIVHIAHHILPKAAQFERHNYLKWRWLSWCKFASLHIQEGWLWALQRCTCCIPCTSIEASTRCSKWIICVQYLFCLQWTIKDANLGFGTRFWISHSIFSHWSLLSFYFCKVVSFFALLNVYNFNVCPLPFEWVIF